MTCVCRILIKITYLLTYLSGIVLLTWSSGWRDDKQDDVDAGDDVTQ